jgi:hypothetical protein
MMMQSIILTMAAQNASWMLAATIAPKIISTMPVIPCAQDRPMADLYSVIRPMMIPEMPSYKSIVNEIG